MIKKVLTYSVIQNVTFLFTFYLLVIAVSGSHGHLTFTNIGGIIALIATLILSFPLLYLFIQRNNLPNKRILFNIAILFFALAVFIIYIGIPNMTKQFVIDESSTNNFSIYKNEDLTVHFKLEPEIFDRVSIERIPLQKTTGCRKTLIQ